MAPWRGCGAGKRFSEEERLSFGKWSFLAAGARCFGDELAAAPTPPLQNSAMPRCTSAPALAPATPCTSGPQRFRAQALAPLSSPAYGAAYGGFSSPASPSGGAEEVAKVKDVLNCILPATDLVSAEPAAAGTASAVGDTPVSPPPPARERAEDADETSPKSVYSAGCLEGDAPGRGVCQKYQGEIVERFRRQLLKRFLSLHDAFARLDHTVARDRALDAKEFQVALARLGVGEEDCDELFAAMDTNCDGGVTLAEFLHVLVDVSTEGLLWELRCRLIRFGIGPRNLWKAVELVQWPQHGWLSRATKVKRRTTRRQRKCCACSKRGGSATAETKDGSAPAAGSGGVGTAGAVGGADVAAVPSGARTGASTPGASGSSASSTVAAGDSRRPSTSSGLPSTTTRRLLDERRPASATAAFEPPSSRPSSRVSSRPGRAPCDDGNGATAGGEAAGETVETCPVCKRTSVVKSQALTPEEAALELQRLPTEVAPQKRPSSFHLSRGDWLKLCTSIYMTLFEAERLFDYLADPKGLVDLRAMFEVLRTTVEPDVTLERFTTKVTSRFETLEAAFQQFCEDRDSDPEPLVRRKNFHALCVAINVNDGSAARLWGVLMESLEAADAGAPVGGSRQKALATATSLPASPIGAGLDATGSVEDDGRGVSKDNFVRELTIWSPDTPLEALKGQLCDRFGSLAEGQRALQQRLSTKAGRPLNLGEFDSRLRQAGIKNCDVNRALCTVASQNGHVSLEATIGAMRTMHQKGVKASDAAAGAHTVVRNETLPLWEQLRAVQQDCRRRGANTRGSPLGRRHRLAMARECASSGSLGAGRLRSCGVGAGGDVPTTPAATKSLAIAATPGAPTTGGKVGACTVPATPERPGTGTVCGSTAASPVVTLDRRKFSRAIHGAVRYAETCRSQSFLHNAHRQVLRLEQRWASPNKWPCGAARANSVSTLQPLSMSSTL